MSEITQESALIKIVSEAGLPEVNSKMLVEHFREFEEKAHEWKIIAEALVVTDVSQKEEMKQADEARKALVKVRTGIAKKHKELKDSALKEGRLYDLIKNTLTSFIEPIEEHLEKQANFEKIQIDNERKRIQSERALALSAYMDNAESMPLADMNQDAFDNLLSGQKLAYEARVEAEEKAEQERLDKVEKEKQLLNRKDALVIAGFSFDGNNYFVGDFKVLDLATISSLSENTFQEIIDSGKREIERLKKESEEREAKEEADRKALAEKNKLVQEENDRLAAELKAKKDKEEAEEKERIAAEKKAQRAPDKHKLLTIVEKIEVLQIEVAAIDFKDADAKKVSEGVVTLLEKIRVYVNENSSKL